jgi:hypothetical protein
MTVALEIRPPADPKAHYPFSFWQYDLSDEAASFLVLRSRRRMWLG